MVAVLMKYADAYKRLHKYFESIVLKPFVWGEHDCCLMAAKAVDAQLENSNLYATIKRDFPCHDAASALAAMGSYSLLQLTTRYLGTPVHPSRCSTGDIVLAMLDGRETLTVHDGVQILGPGVNGIARAPIIRSTHGWTIS